MKFGLVKMRMIRVKHVFAPSREKNEEIDLDRVVEVHNGLFGKKILQVLSTSSRAWKHENREQLSIAICGQAKQHNHGRKAQTALVA